ncbi:MAG TPA: hypothetical protein VNF04_03425 [Stellaceae bacterium]|nr:hypothetical protein [Stellaceae bacterium]
MIYAGQDDMADFFVGEGGASETRFGRVERRRVEPLAGWFHVGKHGCTGPFETADDASRRAVGWRGGRR